MHKVSAASLQRAAISSVFGFSVLALLLLPACHRRPPAPTAQAPATPANPPPAPAASWLSPLEPVIAAKGVERGREMTPEQLQKLYAIVDEYGPPTTAAAASEQAVRLQQAYQTDRDFVNRVEIIYRLADASTPQARAALTRLFFTETDLDLRMQMVNALPFIDDGDFIQSLPILQEALKLSQPRELREAGLDTVLTLNDARALPLVQPLLHDPDPELRDTAEKTSIYFEELRDLDTP